ncbi:polyphosphate kinase 2 family protein [Sediminicoccus rosea]|jgi:PPK2 family polyphosphate:nucleotide phosphotransferase|uniref:Polyphosphate kinase 2 family protein n=1 Tax=Sediminicoccus rosea TaxID=1225128 RepID=A0ABZ0PMA8_9PROT|nr:polyphosphate kinase 2 family protein [Sediminicoccus rosea]WPB86361.1 polyphosphate kinase 2 family protein [Sediminicoccus rosea]
MNIAELDIDVEKILARYRVEGGKGFRLKKHDPADTAGLKLDKSDAAELLQYGVDRLSAEQDKLYAQDRWSVLCLFQAMDAAGKDGTIKHVFSGLNPQGCHVVSFKQPGPVELDHDFLWRHVTALPTRGQIGIHNRSWYEEVLVARVHPRVLAGQKLPDALVTKRIWDERLEDIAAFERYLARQGVVVLKFFLNVSQAEQKKRFLARLDEPEKHWKFSASDVAERRHWDAYMDAYERAIRATAQPHSPWYVVPADNKWFTRLIVVAAMNRALKGLKLHYPVLTEAQRAALAEARVALG